MYSSSAASSSSRFSPRRPFSAAIVILILTFLCSMFIVGFIYLLIIVKHVETSIYENLESKWHPDQIPMNHKPFLYDLRLKLYFAWNKNLSFDQQENTFDGSVRINFESGGGSRIILHSKNISIEECFLIKPNGEEIIVNNMTYGDDFDIFNIFLDFEMENERNYSLKINYSGKFEEKNKYGLFQIPYANGQKYILATHLQMTEARTVLPCIDIPSAKAQFAVTLIHPIGTHAVGNMMENKISNDSNWTTTSFKTTPFMSTYLLAFVISDYPYLEKVTKNGIRTRVYCDPEKIENAKLAISVVEPLLDFFEKYFNVSYPLDKLDIFVLPNLEVAAMENWGLITVRQAEALFMEKKFPILQKHQTQEVIAHEVAHQWFGNLVTMKWWNNLWLNEGFATMIGVKAIDFLANTTTQYSEMSPEYMCLSLRQDQKLNSIAVSHERNDSNGFLDSNSRIIVYKKAAIIIRMIERLVEEDVFQEGLHRFLDKHRYSNADHMDLFDELTHVHSSSSGGHLSGQVFSLNDVMDTWLRQPSFPVVHVRRENSSHLVLNQQRYNHNPRIRSDRENFTWIIPIFHDDPITQKHKVVWIVDKNEILFNNTGQVVVDPHQLTYMRLNYSDEIYSEITQQLSLDHTKIPINSRSRLIDDSFAMAENGQNDYFIAFNITMYLTKETQFRPLYTFSAYLDFFLMRMYLHEDYDIFREYVLTLITPAFDRIQNDGFDKKYDENYDDFRFRELIIYRSCQLGYEPCLRMSREKFDELQKNCSETDQILSDIDCNQIPFYLRPFVYTTIVREGTDEDFEFLFEKWKNEHLIVERERIFVAMCATEDTKKHQRIWLEVFSKIDREDVKTKIFACSKHLHTKCNDIDLFLEHSEKIKKSKITSHIYYLFQTLMVRCISTDEQIEQIKKLKEIYKEDNQFQEVPIFMSKKKGNEMWRRHVGPIIIHYSNYTMHKIRQQNMG